MKLTYSKSFLHSQFLYFVPLLANAYFLALMLVLICIYQLMSLKMIVWIEIMLEEE
jgi:hypothetical protein